MRRRRSSWRRAGGCWNRRPRDHSDFPAVSRDAEALRSGARSMAHTRRTVIGSRVPTNRDPRSAPQSLRVAANSNLLALMPLLYRVLLPVAAFLQAFSLNRIFDGPFPRAALRLPWAGFLQAFGLNWLFDGPGC